MAKPTSQIITWENRPVCPGTTLPAVASASSHTGSAHPRCSVPPHTATPRRRPRSHPDRSSATSAVTASPSFTATTADALGQNALGGLKRLKSSFHDDGVSTEDFPGSSTPSRPLPP